MITVRSPRGFALVELMTVLAVMGVILGLVAAMLSCLFRLDHVAREDIALADTLTALELQLRRDVHRASDVHLVDNVAELECGERTIVWKSADAGVTREAYEVEEIHSRERWSLPAPYQIAWSVREFDGHQWLTLKLAAVKRKDNRYAPTRREIAFTSAVGRYRHPAMEDKR